MLNFTGIKNTLFSINLFNISFNTDKTNIDEQAEICPTEDTVTDDERPNFVDYKTTLTGYSRDLQIINKINEDLIIYLFIQKGTSFSDWHLVAPVILEYFTGKIIQYGLGYFALEGCGGGLSNTSTLFRYLKEHIKKGYKVSILPKVVDNQLLDDFNYFDSGVKLQDLIDNSIDLINYQKDNFKWILKKYNELIEEHEIDTLQYNTIRITS